MFENKYLKYSPEITLEIFQLIWNKLTDFGYTPHENGVKSEYSDFKRNLGVLMVNGSCKSDVFGVYGTGYYDKIEATVQEILGYDPFIKESELDKWLRETKAKNLSLEELQKFIANGITCDWQNVYEKLEGKNSYEKAQILFEKWNSKEFELPKEWFIQVKSYDEAKIYKKFFNKEANVDWKYEVGYYYSCSNGVYKSSKHGTEITFEQFKQYVLKESPIQSSINPVEKDWDKATKEELLEEAKRRYPAGIKFKSAYSGDITTSKHSLKNSLRGIVTSDGMYIYYKGKWAEIIEPVKTPIAAKDLENYFVTCNTQEEWNFACDKFNKSDKVKGQFSEYDTFNHIFNGWQSLDYLKNKYPDGTFLSFQEWCNLKGYKMEKAFNFEVGKWYKLGSWICKFLRLEKDYKFYGQNINTSSGFIDNCGWMDLKNHNPILLSIEDIQQYLPDNHPDKIKSNQKFKDGDWIVYYIESKNSYITSFKLNDVIQVINGKANNTVPFIGVTDITNCFRHATPEEINNHLISIGQIPVGEPLNTGIEPNKDGIFKYTTVPGASFDSNYSSAISYSNSSSKPKMILSIDDEELPMVSITKTKTISQLLNNN